MLDTRKPYFVIAGFWQDFDRMLLKHGITKTNDTYYCDEDRSIWVDRFRAYGCDLDLTGVMRVPELEFKDLWDLMLNSPLDMNRTGSALIIAQYHGESLLAVLETLGKKDLSAKTKRALKCIRACCFPNGAFSWIGNTALSQYEKYKLVNCWDRIGERLDTLT
jgi:hypothetical protein